jgi:O-antigen ligase
MALVVYAIQSKRIKPLIYGVIILFGTLGITYGLSSSFRAKVANSVEDFESWGQSDKINYKSMAMRIEAYKNCLHLISDNPLFGVGADKMESRMATEYNNMNTTLYLENRIGPHNQFLEFGVKYGVLGIVLLVWYLFTLVNDSGKPILIIVVFILIVSLLFESLLERQMSIYFMALFAELARSFSIR